MTALSSGCGKMTTDREDRNAYNTYFSPSHASKKFRFETFYYVHYISKSDKTNDLCPEADNVFTKSRARLMAHDSEGVSPDIHPHLAYVFI